VVALDWRIPVRAHPQLGEGALDAKTAAQGIDSVDFGRYPPGKRGDQWALTDGKQTHALQNWYQAGHVTGIVTDSPASS